MPPKTDITGQRFGRLVVQYHCSEPHVYPSGEKLRLWHCLCDCGNEVDVVKGALIRGATQSCGCLATARRSGPKIDLTGQRFGRLVVISLVQSRPYLWLCRCDCGNTVVKNGNSLRSKFSKTESCGCLRSENSQKLISKSGDNVTKFFDGTNIYSIQADRPIAKNNKSGCTGVHWVARDQRWLASIRVRGQLHYLGQFANLEDAIHARRAGEALYFAPILEAYAAKSTTPPKSTEDEP